MREKNYDLVTAVCHNHGKFEKPLPPFKPIQRDGGTLQTSRSTVTCPLCRNWCDIVKTVEVRGSAVSGRL